MTGLEHEPEMVKSFDGTLIAGRRIGEGDSTPLLVCGSVGAGLSVWRRTLRELPPGRPVLMWDMRGLFESSLPQGGRIDARAHAEDAVAVLDAFEVEQVHVAAWSTGGRVAIEFASAYPERTRSLTLICAGYGHSIGHLARLEFSALLPRVAGVARVFASPLGGAFRRLVERPEIGGIVRQSGMTAPSADISALVDLLREMASCDTQMLLKIYGEVAGDSVPELLPGVEAPTLLITAEQDTFTSARMVEEMHEAIPDATFVQYDDATHYLPMEYPAMLAEDLGKFLVAHD
jgi:pimeloyl-ACP methyl ester carboxylesterase